MSSDIERLLYVTRERALSSDLNTTTDLIHRALIEGLANAFQHQSGVIHGLAASVAGGSMDVVVTSGLALLRGTAPSADDSDFDWIELESSDTVTIPAADPADPRWDVIEIQPNDVAAASVARDIFNSTTGSFSSASVTKRSGSEPTLSVRSGTPAASPEFPAGTTGAIPLAYVYVPAAAASLTADDVVLCRPILSARRELGQGAQASNTRVEVQGGGITVASVGTDIQVEDMAGRFDNANQSFEVPQATFAVVAAMVEGGSFPGSDAPLYFYAIKPPYPSGYDAHLAPREFLPRSNAVTRFDAGVVASQSNCLVVASATAPDDVTRIQGAGPSGASSNFTQQAWGTFTSERSEWFYIGSARWDFSTSDFEIQRSDGAYVRTDWAIFQTSTDTGGVTTSSAWVLGIPETATEIWVRNESTIATDGDGVNLDVIDEADTYSVAIDEPAGATDVAFTLIAPWRLIPDPTNGDLSFELDDNGNAFVGTLDIEGRGYVDSVLARR